MSSPRVADSAKLAFDDWKIRNKGKLLLFKLIDGGEVDVIKQESIDESGVTQKVAWDRFLSTLNPTEPSWTTYHFSFLSGDGGKRSKVLLVQWIPNKSSLKDKMQYAMLSAMVKESLNGIQCLVQASSLEDLEYSIVLERAGRFEREGFKE